jgi:hypothetical protein
MLWIPLGLGVMVGLAIIVIGVMYVVRPMAVARGFGLPLPQGVEAPAWLRLKGVRDIASGATLLTVIALDTPRFVGIVLLAFASVPFGDMLVVLGERGSARTAFGVHGLTAVFMMIAAAALLVGAR